jgi:hypothetical protein
MIAIPAAGTIILRAVPRHRIGCWLDADETDVPPIHSN